MKPDKPLNVLVDVHEPTHIYDGLNKFCNCKRTSLEVGDIVYNSIAIERKSYSDFISSILNKRIWNQIINMKNNYKDCYLIISGNRNAALLRYKHPQRLVNMLLGTIAAICYMGVHVLFVENDDELCYLSERLFRKSITPGTRPQQITKKKESIEEIREDMISLIPNVGLSKAKRILSKYPTILDVASLSKEELSSIEGIGKKISENVVKVMRGE